MGEPKQAMHKTKTVFPKTGKRKQLKTRFKSHMGLQETDTELLNRGWQKYPNRH